MDKKKLNELSIGLINNPYFVQALKDFETMGFIKIKENGIEIIDRKGLENYLNNFGKFEGK